MKQLMMDIYSDDLFWITFKDQVIRIEQDKEYNDGMLMITVHADHDDSYHAKLLVKVMKKVDRYTRAGANGKAIQCPICEHHAIVYHFAWGAITCQGCKAMVDKQDFLIPTE